MCEFCDNVYVFSRKQRVQLADELNIDGLLDDALNQLYDDRKVNDKTNRKLFNSHYKPLKQAVDEGYGQPLIKIEYGTPNYEFLKNLQINTAVFAAFKNHASVKEMVGLLKDKDGNLRSRDEFKREAQKIDADYRGNKLDAEYDTAVRQARMAANWQKYQQTKHLYPNLRYMRTKANKPDAAHLVYVGIVRPIDDPIWDTIYPPNRWKCQCSVEQTDDASTDIPANLPPVDKEFAFNSGKLAQVYNLKDSSYIKSVPPKEQPALIRMAEKEVVKQYMVEAEYRQVYKSRTSNGEVEAHPMAFNNDDFADTLRIARELANYGNKVKILPIVKDAELRKYLIPDGAKANRNPDFLINDTMTMEAEAIRKGTSKNTVGHSLDAARHQANHALIEVPESSKLLKSYVIKRIKEKARKKEMEKFGDIWLLYKGELLKNPHK